MIRKGREWGSAAGGDPDLEVSGGDADLARAVAGARRNRPPGTAAPVVRFSPDGASDLARAVGLRSGVRHAGAEPGVDGDAHAVPLDALRVADGRVAVNAVVVGVPPDRLRWWQRRRPLHVEVDGRVAFDGRATTVVIANGQFLRGADVSPRGHPGDGHAELQVYALDPPARRPMRARLGTGSHVPHPRIVTGRARRVSVRCAGEAGLEIDGRPAGRTAGLDLEVVPAYYRLLV